MSTRDEETEGSGLRKFARSLFGSRGQEAPAEPAAAAPAAAAAPGGGDSSILGDLMTWACEISEDGLSLDDLDENAGMFDAGYVDSMSYVEILARIDERYGVAVPDDQVVGSSFSDLARYVEERKAS
ncbi:MAG: acyl carrier protein [Myxococcota bacterium]